MLTIRHLAMSFLKFRHLINPVIARLSERADQRIIADRLVCLLMKGGYHIQPAIQTVYDRIYNSNRNNVATASMAALNALQDRPPDEQLAAVGVLMLALTRRFGIEPANVLNCVDNLIIDSRRYDKATFAGIDEYFKEEI